MKKKSGNIIIVCVLAAALLAAQWLGLFRKMEYQFQDARYQTGGLVSPEIYVIGIDEETLMEYGLWSDWGREKQNTDPTFEKLLSKGRCKCNNWQ